VLDERIRDVAECLLDRLLVLAKAACA